MCSFMCHEDMRIPQPKTIRDSTQPCCFCAYKGGYFQNWNMTSEGLGEMVKDDSVDMEGQKTSVHANGHACADPGARTPIGVRVKYKMDIRVLAMLF